MAKYSKIRDNIKSGDLLAWSHRGWGSLYDLQIQAVRFATQSEYCHVGLAWIISGRVFVIEAVTPKVRIYPLSKLLPFYMIQIDNNWSPESEEFALAQVGCDYSKWKAIKSFFGKPDFDSLWQCAALVAEVSKLNGVNLGDRYTPNAVVQVALEQDSIIRFVEADS